MKSVSPVSWIWYIYVSFEWCLYLSLVELRRWVVLFFLVGSLCECVVVADDGALLW